MSLESVLHRVLSLALGFLFVTACVPQTPPDNAKPSSAMATEGAKDAAPNDMVLIPGGEFQMGIDSSDVLRFQKYFEMNGLALFEPTVPRHSVEIESFRLDKTPVTNAQFFAFTRRFPEENPSDKLAREDQSFKEIDPRTRYGDHKNLKHWVNGHVPEGLENHPVVNVTWYDAVAYCQWLGKRLPTEAEWEFAARGGANRIFPWGDAPADPSRANYAQSKLGTTTAVASYAPNPYGLYDMAGNVWQFTLDEWASYSAKPAKSSKARKNSSSSKLDFLSKNKFDFLSVTTRRVIRGGSWGGAPINMWVEYRDSHPPDGAQPFVGFRCAK